MIIRTLVPLAEPPPICEVTITPLPATGAQSPVLAFVVGLLLLLIGFILIALTARSRSSEPGVTALSAVGLAAAGALVVLSPNPAIADTGQIKYGPGCTLMTLDEVTVVTPTPLVPGDSATMITSTITNRYATPITLSGEVKYGEGALTEPDLIAQVLFDSETGPVMLAPDAASVATMEVELSSESDNSIQGLDVSLTLMITATE